MFKRILSLIIIPAFFLTSLGPFPQAHADTVIGLPQPGTMVNLSPAYGPVMIKGLTVHKDNPFLFDFIVDVGQDKMSGEPLKKEGEKLIKYFLASLAIPDKDVWVNLSPYEKERIIPEALGQTDMGRDLLEQDYILKQITASLIYPEKQLGKIFWENVYAKARLFYGTTEIPVNTFNKVWIMADKAEVFEHNQTAFVVDSHLKVMLEEDYLALQKHSITSPLDLRNDTHSIGANIVRSIVLPELEKEVNSGKNFANLRQIFNSIILSSWYKRTLKEALLNQVYADKALVKGINLNDPTIKEQIYEQYLKAYKKGVFNYIKEDINSANGEMIPRKYFSGGIDEAMAAKPLITSDPAELARTHLLEDREMVDFATLASTAPVKPANAAMSSWVLVPIVIVLTHFALRMAGGNKMPKENGEAVNADLEKEKALYLAQLKSALEEDPRLFDEICKMVEDSDYRPHMLYLKELKRNYSFIFEDDEEKGYRDFEIKQVIQDLIKKNFRGEGVYREFVSDASMMHVENFQFPKAALTDLGESFGSALRQQGKSGSGLSWLPSYLFPSKNLAPGNYIGLDWSGTNLKIILVGVETGHSPRVIKVVEFKFPQKLKKASRADLLKFVTDSVNKLPLKNNTKYHLGFVFAFPMEHKSANSGTVIRLSKGWKNNWIIGRDAKDLLQQAINQHPKLKQNKIKITVDALMNDTVATQLSVPGAVIGIILGTGFNISVIDKDGQIINLEAGNFSDIPPGLITDLDKDIFEKSDPEDRQRFEKMIAGKYLIQLFYKRLQQLAVSEKSVNFKTMVKRSWKKIDSSFLGEIAGARNKEQVISIVRDNFNIEINLSENEYGTLLNLSQGLQRRSGALLGVLIGRALQEIDKVHKQSNYIISIDGSVYTKNPDVQKAFWKSMKLYGWTSDRVKVVMPDNASALGGATTSAGRAGQAMTTHHLTGGRTVVLDEGGEAALAKIVTNGKRYAITEEVILELVARITGRVIQSNILHVLNPQTMSSSQWVELVSNMEPGRIWDMLFDEGIRIEPDHANVNFRKGLGIDCRKSDEVILVRDDSQLVVKLVMVSDQGEVFLNGQKVIQVMLNDKVLIWENEVIVLQKEGSTFKTTVFFINNGRILKLIPQDFVEPFITGDKNEFKNIRQFSSSSAVNTHSGEGVVNFYIDESGRPYDIYIKGMGLREALTNALEQSPSVFSEVSRAMTARAVRLLTDEYVGFRGSAMPVSFSPDGLITFSKKDHNYGLRYITHVWRYGDVFMLLNAASRSYYFQFLIWSRTTASFRAVTYREIQNYRKSKIKKLNEFLSLISPLENDDRVIKFVTGCEVKDKEVTLLLLNANNVTIDLQDFLEYFSGQKQMVLVPSLETPFYSFTNGSVKRIFTFYRNDNYEGTVIVRRLTSGGISYLVVSKDGNELPSDETLNLRWKKSRLKEWKNVLSQANLFSSGKILISDPSHGPRFYFSNREEISAVWKIVPREIVNKKTASGAMTAEDLKGEMNAARLTMSGFKTKDVEIFVDKHRKQLVQSLAAIETVLKGQDQDPVLDQDEALYRQVVARCLLFLPELYNKELVEFLLKRTRYHYYLDPGNVGDRNMSVKKAIVSALFVIGDTDAEGSLRGQILHEFIDHTVKIQLSHDAIAIAIDHWSQGLKYSDRSPAMTQAFTRGGIDLNTSNGMRWKVSKDGRGVEMNIDPAMIERVRQEGIDSLSPVILRMTPVISIWPLVGLQDPKNLERLAKI